MRRGRTGGEATVVPSPPVELEQSLYFAAGSGSGPEVHVMPHPLKRSLQYHFGLQSLLDCALRRALEFSGTRLGLRC